MVSSEFGTADLIHNQDAVDAAAVMTSLSRAATRLRRQGDPRTFDQLRADIALDRLLPRTKRADHSETPADAETPQDTTPGAEATVVIHATAAELRALLEDHPSTGGEAESLGPIPQNCLRKHLTKTLARALLPELSTRDTDEPGNATLQPTRLATAAIRLRIIDQPPPSNPDRYVPSGALASHVRWRDRLCRFPGCNQPAEFTDIDHRTAYTAGGRTTAANLHCLCRHHHRLKHEGNWRTTRNPDGSHTWTSPTGREYREEPPDSWIRGSP